jgi:hypothetical protein
VRPAQMPEMRRNNDAGTLNKINEYPARIQSYIRPGAVTAAWTFVGS